MILIDLLNSFTENETERFRRFVNSDYHNTDQYVCRLLDLLKKYIIGKISFDAEARRKIFQQLNYNNQKVYGDLTSQQKTILQVKMSALTKLARQFLCFEAMKNNPVCERELLYTSLLSKKQFRMVQYGLNKDQKKIQSAIIKDIRHYELAFKTESNKLSFLHKSDALSKEDNLAELTESLDIYYLLNKLSLHLTSLSLMHTSANKTYDFAAMEAIGDLLKLPRYANHPLVRISLCIIALIQKGDDKTLNRLLKLLEENSVLISRDDLHDFYVAAINYCIQQILKGRLSFNRKLFELYKKMDEQNLILEPEIDPVIKLKNIVTLSCKVKEFNWAEKLIEKYRPAINKTRRESVCNFNIGLIEFYQGNFTRARDLFSKVGERIHPIYDIDGRIMLLKSYYEMEEYNEYLVQAFLSIRQFIERNNSFSDAKKTGYSRFIRSLLNLYKIKHGANRKSLESTRKELSGFTLISDKQYLLEKLNELENS